MTPRLVILTEIIAPYRIPVLNALAGLPEMELHVVFLAETDSSIRSWHVYSSEIRFSYEVLPSWRRRVGKYNLLFNSNVVSALNAAVPDVIVCGGYNYLASWQALYWAKKNEVPCVLWCESTQSDQRNEYWPIEEMKRRFFSKCDAFLVPGESSHQYVREIAASKKVFRAPNAVDNERFSRLSREALARADQVRGELGLPQRYFLFVGRLIRSKGLFELLEAYAGFTPALRAEIGLVLAGDGPLRAELEATSRLIFPGNIHFAGFVQRDALCAYYALADCLVFPTHSDPWGLVVNEAMACGLPVICSDVAGCAADLIGANGRLVTPKSANELRVNMQEIASDSFLRNQMGAESRRIIKKYSPETCAMGIAKAAIEISAGGEGPNPERRVSSFSSALP